MARKARAKQVGSVTAERDGDRARLTCKAKVGETEVYFRLPPLPSSDVEDAADRIIESLSPLSPPSDLMLTMAKANPLYPLALKTGWPLVGAAMRLVLGTGWPFTMKRLFTEGGRLTVDERSAVRVKFASGDRLTLVMPEDAQEGMAELMLAWKALEEEIRKAAGL